MKDMNKKIPVYFLWVSVIGSTIIAFSFLVALILEVYVFFKKDLYVFWHQNSLHSIDIIFLFLVWLMFPAIFLWTVRYRKQVQKQRLFIFGIFTNVSLLILPVIDLLLLSMLD
jgi:hypothetical protein